MKDNLQPQAMVLILILSDCMYIPLRALECMDLSSSTCHFAKQQNVVGSEW